MIFELYFSRALSQEPVTRSSTKCLYCTSPDDVSYINYIIFAHLVLAF